jgi:hypothetical protein
MRYTAALQLSIVISTVLASIGGTLCDIRQHCSPVSSYLEYLYISPFRSRRIRIRPTPARVRKTGLQSCSGAHPLKASHALETVLCSALMQKVPNVELFRLLRSLYLHLLGISIQCQAALQLSIVIATLLASIGYFYPWSGSIAAQYRHLERGERYCLSA